MWKERIGGPKRRVRGKFGAGVDTLSSIRGNKNSREERKIGAGARIEKQRQRAQRGGGRKGKGSGFSNAHDLKKNTGRRGKRILKKERVDVDRKRETY